MIELLLADSTDVGNVAAVFAGCLTCGIVIGLVETEVLHEKSNFKLEDGKWYYVDGNFYG